LRIIMDNCATLNQDPFTEEDRSLCLCLCLSISLPVCVVLFVCLTTRFVFLFLPLLALYLRTSGTIICSVIKFCVGLSLFQYNYVGLSFFVRCFHYCFPVLSILWFLVFVIKFCVGLSLFQYNYVGLSFFVRCFPCCFWPYFPCGLAVLSVFLSVGLLL